jgi:hypothetical protein
VSRVERNAVLFRFAAVPSVLMLVQLVVEKVETEETIPEEVVYARGR